MRMHFQRCNDKPSNIIQNTKSNRPLTPQLMPTNANNPTLRTVRAISAFHVKKTYAKQIQLMFVTV